MSPAVYTLTRIFSAMALSVLVEADVLGTIGTPFQQDMEISFSEDNSNRFYLNIQHPATTSGVVSQLSYCYSLPVTANDVLVYQATVGIYRQDENNFILMSDSFNLTVPPPPPQGPSNGMKCGTLTIPAYSIQEGDVLGVCSREFPSLGRLNLVASVNDDRDVILRRSEASEDVNRLCTNPGSVPTETRNNDFRDVEDNALILQGNITEDGASTMMGPNQDSTTTAEEPTMDMITAEEQTTPAEATNILTEEVATVMVLALLYRIVPIIVVPVLGLLICLMCSSLCLIVLFKKKRKKRKYIVQNSVVDLSQSLIINDEYCNPGNMHYRLTENGDRSIYYPPTSPQRPTATATATANTTANTNVAVPAQTSSSPRENFLCSGELLEDYLEPVEVSQLHYEYEFADYYDNGVDLANKSCASLLFDILEHNQDKDVYEGLHPFCTPAKEEKSLYYQLKEVGIRKIRRNTLECVGHLGSGQFGSVEEAVWKLGRLNTNVALKSLNGEAVSNIDKVKFLQEAVLMAQFKHPNVISLYGVVSIGEPVILVLELATKGDLLHTLNSLQPDPGELVPSGIRDTLLIYSQYIALGMQYLSSKRFIHRDLAARNILVTKDNICKIADFGLSRDLEEDSEYYISVGGKIPVKWTAPEALCLRKYSTASDVWSYGCVLYEIWSLGIKPFMDMHNLDVIKFVTAGKRLHSPPGCPMEIYKLMMSCWQVLDLKKLVPINL